MAFQLVVSDDEGTASFYLMDPEALERYERWDENNEHGGNCLFEWVTAKRKGVRRFDGINDLLKYLTTHNIELNDETLSTPAY